MFRLTRGQIVCGALGVCLALFEAGAITPLAASGPFTHLQHLRFSGAIALPGVTLAAGEYTFEVNSVDAGDVVRVRLRETGRPVFLGSTIRVSRPRGLGEDVSITFREAPAGQPMPVQAWYPPDASVGYEFQYQNR